LVVPRVAPMLERPPLPAPGEESDDPEAPEAEELDDPEVLPPDEAEVGWLGADSLLLDPPEEPPLEPPPDGPPDEPPPLPRYDRPRSLRLPRICGAMIEANFSAWMVPLMRVLRCRSPKAIDAVRVTIPPPPVLCCVDLAVWDFQKSPAAAIAARVRTSQSPVRRGLRGACRTIVGLGVLGCGAGLLAALGVGALLI